MVRRRHRADPDRHAGRDLRRAGHPARARSARGHPRGGQPVTRDLPDDRVPLPHRTGTASLRGRAARARPAGPSRSPGGRDSASSSNDDVITGRGPWEGRYRSRPARLNTWPVGPSGGRQATNSASRATSSGSFSHSPRCRQRRSNSASSLPPPAPGVRVGPGTSSFTAIRELAELRRQHAHQRAGTGLSHGVGTGAARAHPGHPGADPDDDRPAARRQRRTVTRPCPDAVRSLSRTCCQSPGGYSSTGRSGSIMPALATTMSSLPKRSSTVPTAPVVAHQDRRRRRGWSAWCRPRRRSARPSARAALAAARLPPGETPAPANAMAMAAPMPVPPPVIRATFPSKLGIPTG